MENDFKFYIYEGEPTANRKRYTFTSTDREDQKLEHEELTKQYDQMVNDLRKKIKEDPKKILMTYLSSLINQPKDIAIVAPTAVRRYQYIGKHFLNAINGVSNPIEPHLSLEQYCLENTFQSREPTVFRMFNFEDDRAIESIYKELLSDKLSRFQSNAAVACNMVYLGVPMYIADSDGKMVEDRSSEKYHFIKGMGRYFYEPDDYQGAPEWMNGLYLKRSDIERHHLIFSQPNPPTPEEEEALIKAYRASLGLPIDDALEDSKNISWKTKLSDCAESMIHHFEEQGYNRTKLGNWPLQKEVVHWLSSNLGLSNREAEAIDLITRPDHLRAR